VLSLHSQKVYLSSIHFNLTFQGSEIITISDSLFQKNIAKVGAALRAFGTTNFDSTTSQFVGNVAEIGGTLATNPTQLRLIIYKVEDYFLFLDDLDPSYLLSHPGTVILTEILL